MKYVFGYVYTFSLSFKKANPILMKFGMQGIIEIPVSLHVFRNNFFDKFFQKFLNDEMRTVKPIDFFFANNVASTWRLLEFFENVNFYQTINGSHFNFDHYNGNNKILNNAPFRADITIRVQTQFSLMISSQQQQLLLSNINSLNQVQI